MKWKFSRKHFQKLVKMHNYSVVLFFRNVYWNNTIWFDYICVEFKTGIVFVNWRVSNITDTNIPMVQTVCLFSPSAAVLCPVTLFSTFKTGPRIFSSAASSSLTTPTFLWNKFSPWFHYLLPCSPLMSSTTYSTPTASIRAMLHVQTLEIVANQAWRYPNE